MIWKWQERNFRPSWDEMFMSMAEVVATRSTCDRGPSQRLLDHRGTGAVIVSPDNRQVAIGYNGSPPGSPHCADPEEFWACKSCGFPLSETVHVRGRGTVGSCPRCDTEARAVKATGGHIMVNGSCVRTIHAEENAILNSTFDLKGCRIYSTTVPCYDCCKRIATARLSEVVYQHLYESRGVDPLVGLHLLEGCGLKVRQLLI